jgi:hypothetical protein
MRFKTCFAALAILIIALTGCGGGGGSNDPVAATTTTTTLVTYKASDYTGGWSGTYSLTGGTAATNAPVSFTLTGSDNTSTVSGNVYSQYVAGVFSGTTNSQGATTGTVANTIDGKTWQVALQKAASGVTVTSLNYGASTTGSGSCTVKPAMTFDLTGSYPVRYRSTYPVQDTGAYKTGTIILSWDGTGFTGAIIGDTDGLKSKIRFFKSSGWWFIQIYNDAAIGSYINSNTGLLTQSAVMTDAQLTAAKTDIGVSMIIAPLYASMYGTPAANQTSIYDFYIYLEGSPP